ncbi:MULTISPECIES: FG-GAP-like repeat-containing protein [Niastella]|uniref:FG-GAP repeat protein n=1 Tax=Niastella soli TaxID=2821487 RepID=A0ABS3YS96_9BACT|nr:FG-GAP-like repeat-containing protein [Niastella soli]MBO9200789.1 FG-GAP repeat protein [Niastella soli]
MLKSLPFTVFIALLPLINTQIDQHAADEKLAALKIQPLLTGVISSYVSAPATLNADSLKKNNWYSEVLKKLQSREYEFSHAAEANTFTTPNRKNNLRFNYSCNGFTVQPRTTRVPVGKPEAIQVEDAIEYDNIPDWKVAFSLDKKQVGQGVWHINSNRAEYQTGNIIVQYLNNEEGMRQNFIVREPLNNKEDLKLRFNVSTNLQQQWQKEGLQFYHHKSGLVLAYNQLKVWDANGRPLEAAFEKDKNDYCIHVQSSNAVYPITIDPISTTPAAMLERNQASANFGYSVAGAGDVNGDGYSDVIVGAYMYDNGEADEGAAFIYHGSAAGLSTTAAAMLERNQASANFGYSVAGAGDVNGDGYSDVIVGAYMYDNGQADEGAAFIYHGSAAGISTTAAAMVESNQASANFGYSVAGAGDVNGDGYSDVIVGASMYDNGEVDEGAAFIYHGAAAGISTTAAATVESNQASANSGSSVSGAGDVNGDGYSDVIVGAPFFSDGEGNEGAAFIYHGSAAGISTTAAATVESNQFLAFLGISVAGAGDVNGDGYSDVIAGAYLYDHGESNEGAAFIYLGSAAGINTTAAALVESNQASASFGFSVAAAGDVNGDGYSDVIVGAYTYDNGISNEGAAFIYHGSAAGISTTAATMVESNQASAYLGSAVASAGDVNGDGYSDVIVGAYLYDNGESNEGAAFIYYGNSSGTGRRNNLRLYNTDLSTPISSANFSLPNFGAGLIAKSFLGSQKGKLVWETRLNYNAFSGTPITNSVLYTAQGSYTNLGITGTELKNLVVKVSGGRYTKIRARIKYDPVTAITGQLYSPWRYVDNVLLTTSLGALPVNLVSFNASWLTKGKTALLKFVTDNESATCCYEIEKSADGVHFTTIGKVTAKNTTRQSIYTYTDNSAGGQKLYYRLKIMFENGNSEYSNIQLLQSNSTMEIMVFPNPATDVLQLRVNNNYSVMNVQVINITGQVVQQFNNLSAAGQVISIPVTQLTSGTYFLSLQSDGKKQVLQFVKQ